MKTYTATDKDGRKIVAVLAKDLMDAKRQIRKQLSKKPATHHLLKRWVGDGQKVDFEESAEAGS